MKKRLLTALVIAGCQALLLGNSPWMLPNGDFRYNGVARTLLQNWSIFSHVPGNESRLSDSTPTNSEPKALILKQTQAQGILAYQSIQLPPGQYQLTVELAPGSGKTCVSVSENPSYVFDASENSVHVMDLEIVKGGNVLVHIGTGDLGETSIIKAELEHLTNPVVPLKVAGGREFSRIVLPVEPTMAERFAAWETLKLCWRLTGATPEITHMPSDGNDILIGRAAVLKVAKGAKDDTYLYGLDDNGDFNLTGNTDRGTLYAVYRYFNSQGCAWIMPGPEGETIPKCEELTLPEAIVTKSPVYEVRGYMLDPQTFKIDKGWEFIHKDDWCDWALRNGLNALWGAGEETFDMKEWRGGSYMQRLSHSWYKFLLDDHQEWWPLVDGKRVKMHPSGLPNQPCISNPELRDYAVEMICDFFKEHPEYERYPLNAEDEPCYWCECDNCRALDTIPHEPGKSSPKTDRSLNFVNEVARRVAARCPGKTIELYGYGSNREPPLREKLDPNIVYKWCFHLKTEPQVLDSWVVEMLSGWQEKGGLKRLAIYDYDNYLYPDTIWSGLRYSFEELIELNQKFGAVEYLPESWTNLYGNPLLAQLRRDAIWGAEKSDFDGLVKKHCAEYYGKASDVMVKYIMAMDDAFIKGQMELESRPVNDKLLIYLSELTMKDLTDADKLLDEAAAIAADDARLEKRVAAVRFSHEMTKLSLLTNLRQASYEEVQAASAAYKLANELVRKYSLYLINQMSISQLAFFYMPPMVSQTLQELSLEWRFCTDPDNRGQAEEWYKAAHSDWKGIRVDKDWTAQGYDYHGAAWYELEFEAENDMTSDMLAFYFGAVDGFAHIYLDGELIGEQLENPAKMWDLPYAIKCGAICKGSHRLNLRVEKDMWSAGIWKPVSIVELQNQKSEDNTELNP